MITFERLGVREDGNPVIETSTYTEVAPDHPLAVELEGHEGHWALVAVGNSFKHVRAKEVSRAEYNAHVSSLHDLIEERRLEHEAEKERIANDLAHKKDAVDRELTKLGLSRETVMAILKQIQE